MLTHVGTLFGPAAEGEEGGFIVQAPSNAARTNDLTVTLDTTAVSGNVLLCLASRSYGTHNDGDEIDLPNGFTAIEGFETADNGTIIYCHASYKISVGTETNVHVTADRTRNTAAHIIEISGLDTASLVDNSGTEDDTATTVTAVALSGIATSAANTMLFYQFCLADDDFTGPSFSNSFSQVGDFEIASAYGQDIAQGVGTKTLSSAGTHACTMSTAAGGAEESAGIMVALKIA